MRNKSVSVKFAPQHKSRIKRTTRQSISSPPTPSSLNFKQAAVAYPLRARAPQSPQVRTFVKNEDQNFSLFNYVNEQQNEVEKLEEQLHQLQEEEQKFTQVCGRIIQQLFCCRI